MRKPSPRVKRVLKVLAAVVLVLVATVAFVWYRAFGNNSAIVDGRTVAPGVEAVKDSFVSSYLLDAGPGKVALVDAGKDASAGPILLALARRGLPKSAVLAIFLTHGHGDHVAGCNAFPEAKVYALEAELPLIGDAATVTHPLHDGEIVEVGELRVEAFATPGHTPGSAVFLSRGVLFFGDSAGASKEGIVMKAVSLFSKNSEENVASLDALAARLAPRAKEIEALAFGHTGPLRGFSPLSEFASKR